MSCHLASPDLMGFPIFLVISCIYHVKYPNILSTFSLHQKPRKSVFAFFGSLPQVPSLTQPSFPTSYWAWLVDLVNHGILQGLAKVWPGIEGGGPRRETWTMKYCLCNDGVLMWWVYDNNRHTTGSYFIPEVYPKQPGTLFFHCSSSGFGWVRSCRVILYLCKLQTLGFLKPPGEHFYWVNFSKVPVNAAYLDLLENMISNSSRTMTMFLLGNHYHVRGCGENSKP